MNTPRLRLPDGAREVPGSDPSEFRLGPLRFEVRRQDGPSRSIDVVCHNTGSRRTELPGLLLSWEPTCPVAWLSGSTGMVVTPDGGSTWRMLGGWCSDVRGAGEGPVARLFDDSVRLAPGQRVWSRWRLEDSTGGVPLPRWVPRRRHLPVGEAVEFEDLDVALSGDGLGFETTSSGTLVRGPLGRHKVAVHGPGGVTGIEVGWFLPLPDLVTGALECGPEPDVEAWLLCWALTHSATGAAREQLVDRLDLALADCLERPSLFGVLAAFRADATTELRLGQEPARAARALLLAEPEAGDAVVVAVATLLSGHPEVVADLAPPPISDTSDELLRRLEYGLPSSVDPGYTARDVARAGVWLAIHRDSRDHTELARVTALAQARLRCGLSERNDPLDVAWLLIGEVMT